MSLDKEAVGESGRAKITAQLDFQDGRRDAVGELVGDRAKVYVRGNANFLSRLDLESKPEEAIFQIIKEATESDEVNVFLAFNMKKNIKDPLVSDDDDEEGNAKDVGNLHYCSTCGKRKEPRHHCKT